jgi:2-iminobutanoate/2-iminopropanoate deaminase
MKFICNLNSALIIQDMKKSISTQQAPAAIGPYSQAVEANGMIFVWGQLPIDPATEQW